MTETPVQPPAAESAAQLVTRKFLTLGAGEMVARLIGFAATIFIARQLGADAYGIVGFGFAVSLYLATAADAGLEQHGPQEVASAEVPLGTLISSVLIGRILLAIVLALGLGAASLFAPRPDSIVLALYGLTLLPAGANARWAHYGLHNSAAVARARIAAELLRVTLVFALVHEPADALYVPLAQFAGDSLAALFLIRQLARNGIHVEARLDMRILRAVLRRASPLLANNMLALAIYNADVIFLRFFRTVVEVGQYLAAYTLINFLGVLGNLTTVTLVPNLARMGSVVANGSLLEPGSAGERTDLVHSMLARVFVAGLPIAVGGSLLAVRLIDFVFGPDYAPAGPVLALLIWTIPILLARGVYTAVLIAQARHDAVLRSTAAAAALNVALNCLAVPILGMIGAAMTTLLAEAVRMIISRSYMPHSGIAPAPARRFIRTAVATLVMAATLAFGPPLPLFLAVAAGIVIYFASMFAIGGLRWEHGHPALRV
ncbi:MAG: oligosaccharide flippase family protein [Longimicrobiales bacterium]